MGSGRRNRQRGSFTEPCPADNCEAEATIIMESGHQDTWPPLDTETSRSLEFEDKEQRSCLSQKSDRRVMLLCVLWRLGQGLLLISAKSLHLSWFRSQMDHLMTWDNEERGKKWSRGLWPSSIHHDQSRSIGKPRENWCISREHTWREKHFWKPEKCNGYWAVNPTWMGQMAIGHQTLSLSRFCFESTSRSLELFSDQADNFISIGSPGWVHHPDLSKKLKGWWEKRKTYLVHLLTFSSSFSKQNSNKPSKKYESAAMILCYGMLCHLNFRHFIRSNVGSVLFSEIS